MTPAHRVSVTEPPPEGMPFDYADAFAVARDPSDSRTAEEWMRSATATLPGVAGSAVLAVHRHVLRFSLGPWSSPEHILGWRIRGSEPDRAHLAASGPLMTGALVAAFDGETARLTTYVTFHQRHRATLAWTAIGPLHRAIAPRLLSLAAAARAA